MYKGFFFLSVFFLNLVACTSTNGVPPATYLPPMGSQFYRYMNQCGKANYCKNESDTGCIKRESKSQGNDYVKNGETAPAFAYPWMVVLVRKEQNPLAFNKDGGLCTATLVSVRHILTAQHCVEGVSGMTKETFGVIKKVEKDVVIAYLGAERKGRGHSINGYNFKAKRDIIEIKIPPATSVNRHDFALLRINDVEFNEYIRPICLPFDGIPLSGNYAFAGWGPEDIFVHAFSFPHLPDKDNYMFSPYLQEIKGLQVDTLQQSWPSGLAFPVHLKPTNETWAHNGSNVIPYFYFNLTDGKALCNGDSGGPLTWQDPETERFYIMGIAWRGFNNDLINDQIPVCSPLNPEAKTWSSVMFTKVTYFLDFIYREMNPDGFASNICLPASCKDPNTTYVGKDGILSAPCGSIKGLGNYCLKGAPGDVFSNRNNNHSTDDFLDDGFAECVPCTEIPGVDNRINWNYQQWINEITLGSFNQRRYYGAESPYKAFSLSYFKGVFNDDIDNTPHGKRYGELECDYKRNTKPVIIPTSVVCDGFNDCPAHLQHTWDEVTRRCKGLTWPGRCLGLVGHQNRNGAFRIAIPNSFPEYQGNPGEWIFKFHGEDRLEDSYVTIMSGLRTTQLSPKGVTPGKFLTMKYKFDKGQDEAEVFLNPKLPDFHDDASNLDQRFYLQHLYEITKDKTDLMFTAIYTKYYDPKVGVNVTVRLFSEFGRTLTDSDYESLKLEAGGPKKHPPTADEGKFRFLYCTEILPHLNKVYDGLPPKRADGLKETCMKYADEYTDADLHVGFGISLSRLQVYTAKQRSNLVKKICKAFEESDHIWDYAAKIRLENLDFRRMYQTVQNVHVDLYLLSYPNQLYTHVLVKVRGYFLKNTP